MQTERQMRTDGRLWLLCGSVVFVAFGFFDPLPGVKGKPGSLWGWVVAVVAGGEQSEGASRVLPSLLVYTTAYVLLSVAVGWAIQACFVGALTLTTAVKKHVVLPK